MSERPALKSAMVPQFHARSEQLTVNADARNATAPRLPPMQGSCWKSPPKSTPDHDLLSLIRKRDTSRRLHTRNRCFTNVLIQVHGFMKPLSTQQAELSRACPARRVLKTSFATLLTCERVCFHKTGTPCKDLGKYGVDYVKVCRDNGIGSL